MARNPHRIITTGCPGWTTLGSLKVFQRIREFVPDAELRLYLTGGAPTSDSNDPQIVQGFRNMWDQIQQLYKSPGVEVYQTLADQAAFEECAVWCYPAHVAEVYVPEAIQAQRWGAIPVFNPIGCLARDIFAGLSIPGFVSMDCSTQGRYTYEIIRILSNESAQEKIRVPMMAKALEPVSHEPFPLAWNRVHQIITKASKVEGWMSDFELAWLAQNAASCNTVVEIGCWKGKSTTALLSACPGTVIAVDHWKGGKEEPEHIKSEARENNLHEMFMENVKGIGNLEVLHMPSLEASRLVESADMVFIDGGHGYEEVRQDIRAWLPVVQVNGGILCGHDYDWASVRKAVLDELGPGVKEADGVIWCYEVKKQRMSNAAD